VFPPGTALFAPVWVLERAVCSWIALGGRLARGGVPYAGRLIHVAANSNRLLSRRRRSFHP
jgi:hypothetical protein